MSKLHPLKFNPILKPVLWGGSRIATFKGSEPFDCPIGETWEISGLEGFESVVSGGEFEGMTMSDLLNHKGKQIMGDRLYQQYGNKFPLLIKFIDAAQDLSIQVHPNDQIAADRHNCSGKTELWYMLESIDDAIIYCGFKSPTTLDEFRNHINNNTLTDVLACFSPKRGDIFYLPAGRIHSIGAGNLLLEIQQSSDITYRVYDYNRTDLNGKKRELHTELAIEAIDYQVHDEYCQHTEPQPNVETEINRCEYFVTTLLKINESHRINIAEKNSFRIIVITAGEGLLTNNDGYSENLKQGDVLLIPASTEWIELRSDGNNILEVVTSYIP